MNFDKKTANKKRGVKISYSFITLVLASLFFQFSVHATPIQDSSLLHHTWKKYSQNGEEGIFDCMLRRMGIEKGFFVEFGATDGVLLSNTRFLAEKGWRGAWIECDPVYFPALVKNTAPFPEVKCIKEFITTIPSDPRGHTLDEVANHYFPNEEIDVLIIDIDGLDYLIFEGLKLAPKIVCIESSGYWHPSLKTRVPEEVARGNLGQPLAVMIDSARKQGYEPVCFLNVNLFLVRKDFYHLFSTIKNDAETLWLESWAYMGEKQPGDKRYITEVRFINRILRNYDHFPTPP